MRKMLRKIRPIVMIIGVILTVFLSLKIYENFKFNFNQAVEESLQRFADLNIKFKRLSFPEIGVVLLHDVELRDKNNNKLVVAKELTLKYDHKRFSEITEIKVTDADIMFEMYGDYDNNFTDSFNGSGKSSGSSILKKIVFEKSRLYYVDKMNKMPIYKYIKEINGYVEFGKESRIDIGVRGKSDEENYFFELEYVPDKVMNITLDMKNIKINNQIMQYGYYDDSFDYKDGKADLVLKIDKDGNLNGNCKLRNGILKYHDVNNKIEDINGNIDFKGKNIVITASGNIENKLLNFGLYYNIDENKAKIRVSGNNISYKNLENYYLIKDAGINIDGNFEKIEAEIAINSNKDVTVVAKAESKELKVYGENFKNVKADATINENNFSIDKVSFKYLDYEAANGKIKGAITKEGVNGKYEFENIKIPVNIYSVNGDFNYNKRNQQLSFSINSGEKIKANGKYNFNQQILSLDSEVLEPLIINYNNYLLVFSGKTQINYDIMKDYMAVNLNFNSGCNTTYAGKNYKLEGSVAGNFRPKRKEFSGGKGELTLYGIEGIDSIFVKFNSEKDMIELNSIIVKKGSSFVNLTGFYNIYKSNYVLNIMNSELEISDLPGITGNGIITASGVITGNGTKILEGNIEIKSEAGIINSVGYENLSYNVDLAINNGKKKVNGVGEIGKLLIFGEELNDINTNFRIRDDILYIDNFYNNSLTLNGYYNIIAKSLDIKYNIKNYEIERTSLLKGTDITGFITELSGEMAGSIESPYIKTEILKAEISYGKFQKLKLNGEIEYIDKKIKFENLKVNQNMLNGEYNIDTGEIEGKINIFESEVQKYLGVSDITFRTIGELNFWGNISDLKGTTEITVDNIYYKDKKLPVLYTKLNFNKLNLNNFMESGIFNFNSIKVINSKKKSVIEGTGIYNNETKEIEFKIENKKIELSSIEFEKLNVDELNGNILVDFKLNGKIDNFNYKCMIKSENIELYDVKINSININFSGNREQMNMPEFKINYGGNIFTAKGSIKYNPLEYQFRLYGKDVDLKVINLLTKNKLENIKGIGDIDIFLTEKNIKGEVNLRETGFATVDKMINCDKINANVIIDGEKAIIKTINGELNSGKFGINGEVKIGEAGIGFAGLKKLSFDSWNINFDFSKVKYEIENIMYVFCSGKGRLKDKNLTGTVTVDRGEVRGINKTLTKDKEKFEIPKDWKASLDFNIKNKMRVNLEKILLIDGVEANIDGGGFITLENGQLNIIGTISTDKGAVGVNGKIFKIESGVVVFDDPYQYFPNLNPSIAVRASTDVVGEEIYVDITGYLNKPLINLSSSNNLELSDIISLLTFNSTVNQSTPTGVVKDIIENRINKEIFNPISERLSKTLGISKVKISSNLLENNTEEVRITKDIRLGAEIEFSDRLYKDKLYWNLKTKLSDKTAGELESYNFWLDYKIKNETSISAGVEKLKNESEGKDKVNLHIGVEFKKKFDLNFGGNK